MTRDDTHDQTTGATQDGATTPQRPRRRATRTVGAPETVVVPHGTGAAEIDAPFELTLPTPAAERAATVAAAAAPLAPELPAEGDAPAALDVLAELGRTVPQAATGEATPAADAPEAPAKPRRTRASRAKKPVATADEAPAADAPQTTDAPAQQADAPAVPAGDEAPVKPRRTRASRAKKPVQDADAPAAEAPAAATAESAAPVVDAPAATAAAAPAAAASSTAAPVVDAPSTAAPAAAVEAQTVARTPGGPRLATTALLFQAPEPTRRSRRAQAPAGPPRPETTLTFAQPVAPARPAEADEPVTVADAGAAAAEPAAPRTPAAPEPRTGRSRRGRRAERPQGATPAETPDRSETPRRSDTRTAETAEPVEVPAGETAAAGRQPAAQAAPAQPFALDALSAEERQAIDEVEVIESELVAEGLAVELLGFEAVDFVADDTDDTDADETDATSGDDEQGEGDDDRASQRRRRRRGGRGRRASRPAGDQGGSDASQGVARDVTDGAPEADATDDVDGADDDEGADGVGGTDGTDGTDTDGSSSRRRRRRRRTGGTGSAPSAGEVSRATRASDTRASDEVTALKGSTRLEAKRQRRREGRDAGRRRQIITEAEFLARRESVQRSMVVRERGGRTQIAVLEDGVLVEHYVSQQAQASMVGNVYLGRVQNVLPSMEAAFVDIGKGRNAVLYAGEVNWDAVALDGQPRRIEQALKSGDSILVQVTKDPIGHKGARLTSQVTLAGRFLVFVPGGGMTGISRKLPDTERARLKKILREVVPEGAGVIVRTAAEGASEDELRADVARLQSQWEAVQERVKKSSTTAPALLQGEPDLSIRVVRDIFNDDFSSLVVDGDDAWKEISSYLGELAPDLAERASRWTGTQDVFAVHRVDEQLAKGMDRKVWLPSGGSLVIDRTEAMTVVDVNTGKFTGSGGTLEETVTRNNLEAAEEIVRQLRLRDIGGIIVIDFIDMVLESNRDLVLRRLVECLGRDRTKHQVAEVTSLGLVQMTRKRVGQGLVEAFSETCAACNGRGFIVHTDPIERGASGNGHTHSHDAGHAAPQSAETDAAEDEEQGDTRRASRRRRAKTVDVSTAVPSGASQGVPVLPEQRDAVKATLATIAAAAAHAHEHDGHLVPGAAEQDAVLTEVHESGQQDVVDAPPAEDTAPVVDDASVVNDAPPAEDTAPVESDAEVHDEQATDEHTD